VKLAVFGATGGVGRQLVTQALDAGHHVTAYVRNPAKLAVRHANLTVLAGELVDRDAVQRAVHGADAVISALGPSLDRKATGMPLVDGTRTIVDAMSTEGVDRYIGIATPSWRDPRDTRPTNDAATGTIRAGYLGRDRIPASITRTDTASFLLAQTADDRFHRAAPAISN
jgi:NAD(P)-dependent dehydrogenase (short-subunit alcohol dehydrogenase family)